MASPADPSVIAVPRPGLRTVVTAPLRPQSYLNLVFLAVSFPLGLAYFVFLSVGLSLGAAFSLLVVGIPLLLAVLIVAHGLASVERAQARYLLGFAIERPALGFMESAGLLERVKALVFDSMTYRAIVLLASKLAVGVAAFTALVTGGVTAGVFVAVPLFYDKPGVEVGVFPKGELSIGSQIYVPWDTLLVGVDAAFTITEWQIDTLPEAFVMSAFGIVLFVISFNVWNALAWLAGAFTRVMLGSASLRELSVRME